MLLACLNPAEKWQFGEPAPPRPRTAFFIAGEVRDSLTLAAVPGATIEVTTSRPGYMARGESGPGGGYSVSFSALSYHPNIVDNVLGKVMDETVDGVCVRAVIDDRCSVTLRLDFLNDPPELRGKPLLLLLAPCAASARLQSPCK